ncbi:MAG: hypothetical protein J0L62_07685 [Bacteroidetes bacterium]|nr:hypothetical protein [Bacteroidota bacterium]
MKTCKEFENPTSRNKTFWDTHLSVCDICSTGFEEETALFQKPISLHTQPAEDVYFLNLPDRVLARVSKPKVFGMPINTFRNLSIAAAVVIAAGLTWFYLPSPSVTEPDYSDLEVSRILQDEALLTTTDELFDIYSTDSKEIESALMGLTETYQFPVSEEPEPVLDETELESIFQEAESQRKGS